MPLTMFRAKGAVQVAFWQPGGHGRKAVDPWLCVPVFQRFCPFARRYLGNRVFFLFLRVLRCFSSPGLPSTTYVFNAYFLGLESVYIGLVSFGLTWRGLCSSTWINRPMARKGPKRDFTAHEGHEKWVLNNLG